MNVVIVGYGKMGRLVEELVNQSGKHHISNIACKDIGALLTAEDVKGADVAIDFSHGSIMEDHIALYCQEGVSAVIGTTGWNMDDTALIEKVDSASISVIVGSNFSAGVQAFFNLVRTTAARLSRVEGYDVYVQDVHHAEKADSPSGTAKTIAEIIIEAFETKTEIIYGQVQGRISEEMLQVVSVRGGLNAGLHQVTFDGPFDTITLSHASHNRRGFAAGAVAAIDELENFTGLKKYEDIFMKETL